MAQCIQCHTAEVAEEYTRCSPCQMTHKELCAKLGARPKPAKKTKEELFPIYEIKQGIKVTTYIDRNDAAFMGIKLPPK